jgi:hypothetical protein
MKNALDSVVETGWPGSESGCWPKTQAKPCGSSDVTVSVESVSVSAKPWKNQKKYENTKSLDR